MTRRESNLFELQFPMKGVVQSVAYSQQPRESCIDAKNMRPWNWQNGRSQGSQRPGLARYLNAQMSDHPVRDINQLIGTSGETVGTTTISARTLQGLAVCNGSIYKFNTTSFTSPTSGSGALSTSAPVVFSAQLFQEMFYVDGVNYKAYTHSTDTVTAWTASVAGTIPANGANKCRLIELWNGRIVMSGLIGDRHNWFMSKRANPRDWDYSPSTTTVLDAVAGNNSDAGKIGDIVNSMIPYDDDILIFLCDHSIWQLTGDPQEGGRIDRISDTIGGAWGRPWAKDDAGTVYFFGSRGGVYKMQPGSKPVDITTGVLDELMGAVNLGTHLVRMGWDSERQTLHLFISPFTEGATTHFAYDSRTESWWIDVFGDANHNPLTVYLYDADAPDDRRFLIGGMDGRIRYFDEDALSDDGTAIDAYVTLGPIKGSHSQRVRLNEMQANLVTGSNNVTWDQYKGNSEQAAAAASSFRSGTFVANRNRSHRAMVAGNAIFVRLRNNTLAQWWGMEWLKCQMSMIQGPGQRFL